MKKKLINIPSSIERLINLDGYIHDLILNEMYDQGIDPEDLSVNELLSLINTVYEEYNIKHKKKNRLTKSVSIEDRGRMRNIIRKLRKEVQKRRFFD